MSNSYTFGQYRLRPATEEDEALAAFWISRDPAHAETTPAEFFTRSEPGAECYVLEDADGPVFFFKMTKAVRLDIQFDAGTTPLARERTREGLIEGMEWLAGVLGQSAVHQIIFDSIDPLLIRSTEKRLGFVRSPNELVRNVMPSVRREAVTPVSHETTQEQHELQNRGS